MPTTLCLPRPLGCFDLPEPRSAVLPEFDTDLSDDYVFSDRADCVGCDAEGGD